MRRVYTHGELRWMDRLLLLLVGIGLLVLVAGRAPLAGFAFVLLGAAGNLHLRRVLRNGRSEIVED